MKKLLTILALAAGVSLGYSQGTVTFGSLAGSSLMSTNNGASVGVTSKAAGGFYYALLIQTYTGAAVGTIDSNPLNGWTFSGSYSTNSTLLAGGTSGGTATVAGWTPGTTQYVEVVGWSSDEGSTWAAVAAEIAGGNWASATGYYGHSAVGYVTSGGVGSPASPANPLFGGTGISGFQMTAVPEPTTVALIGLGGLGLAMIRRRK